MPLATLALLLLGAARAQAATIGEIAGQGQGHAPAPAARARSIDSVLGSSGKGASLKLRQQQDGDEPHMQVGGQHPEEAGYGLHGSEEGYGQEPYGPRGGDGMLAGNGGSYSGDSSSLHHQGGAPHHAFGQKPLVSGGIMSSLIDSIEGNMPGQLGRPGGAPVSVQSRLIVSGIVESFMHKIQLLPGEKKCLERNLAQLTADVVGTAQDLVKAIKAFIPGAGQMDQPGAAHAFKNPNAQGTLASAGMDGAMKLTSLVTLSTSLLKTCVQGDALEMLNATGRHFINMTYVGDRLLVSGVDIAHSLSDSIIAFEGHRWHRFGVDVGTCLRKVFLSNATNGTRLPEGVPEEAIIQQTTEGLMDGFFVRGSGVEITDAARPDVDIRLDLHRCIAGNQEFFKEIFLAMWSFIAQMSANGEQHGLRNPLNSQIAGDEQPKWMGELMVAMMQVPRALSRCNIGQDSQQMLLEAIKSIGYLRVHFQFPQHQVSAEEATKRMALAISAWSRWDFKDFGLQIGELLREFVLLTYPQAYSVDAHGRLRRQLIGESASSWSLALKVHGRPLGPVLTSLLLGAVALSVPLALVAARGRRAAGRPGEYAAPSAACPEASDVELANNLLVVE